MGVKSMTQIHSVILNRPLFTSLELSTNTIHFVVLAAVSLPTTIKSYTSVTMLPISRHQIPKHKLEPS